MEQARGDGVSHCRYWRPQSLLTQSQGGGDAAVGIVAPRLARPDDLVLAVEAELMDMVPGLYATIELLPEGAETVFEQTEAQEKAT